MTLPEGDIPARLSRVGAFLVLGAAVYSVALVAAGFLLPVYSSETVTSRGETTTDSATLVAENGVGVAAVLLAPLAAIALVVLASRLRSRLGLAVAWAITGLFAAFNLLALLSIGILLIPVTVILIVVCVQATAARRRSRPASDWPRTSQPIPPESGHAH